MEINNVHEFEISIILFNTGCGGFAYPKFPMIVNVQWFVCCRKKLRQKIVYRNDRPSIK